MDNDRYIWPQPEDSNNEGSKLIWNDELMARSDQLEKDFFSHLEHWKHDARKKALIHLETDYEVNLQEVSSKAEYLEWIMHMHGKTWMTVDAFAEFVTALSYLIDHCKLPAE